MGACTNCGGAGVDPDHGVCDPCFEAMPMGVWVSEWDVEPTIEMGETA